MIIEVIEGGSDSYVHGTVESDVSEKRMMWYEGEPADFDSQVLPNIEKLIANRRIFLFVQRWEKYPVPFMRKHFGMWKDICDEYNISVINTAEQRVDLTRYCAFYGICEVEPDSIKDMLRLLVNDFFARFIIFSENNITLEDIEAHLVQSEKEVDINYGSLINCFCKQGAVVATFIWGCDGTSLNFFYKKSGGS